MNNKQEKKSLLIPIISILVMLTYFSLLFLNWEYLSGAILEEIGPILVQMSVLIPAVLGLWKFTNRAINKWMVYGYIIYGLLIIWSCYMDLTADDPLEAGLLLILFVLPFTVLFSIYLIRQLKQSSTTT